MALALGAVPVAAGAVQDVVQPALLAAVDDAAVLLGAAQEDGVDHLPVLLRHGVTEAAQVFGGEFAEDLGYGSHHRISPMRRLVISTASSCPLLVKWR